MPRRMIVSAGMGLVLKAEVAGAVVVPRSRLLTYPCCRGYGGLLWTLELGVRCFG